MQILRRLTSTLALLIVTAACNAPGLVGTPTAAPSAAPSATAQSAQPEDTPTEAVTESPTAEPATAAPATEAPHQLRVALIVDGDLWAVERGSAPVQLKSSGLVSELRISDDGQRIAYVEVDQNDLSAAIRSISFAGGDDQSLLDQAELDALYPLGEFLHYAPSELAMAPGTHQLLFNTRAVLEGPGLAKTNDLLRVDSDSGSLTKLLDPGQGGDFTLSPDGLQLALVQPDSIGFANQDGGQLRPEVLTFPWVITYSEYFFYLKPAWVEDGVIAAVPAEDPFFGPEQGSIWHVPADGSDPLLLSDLQADLFLPQRGAAPIVSPDGNRVAAFRKSDDTGSFQLWLVDLQSGAEEQYAQGNLGWVGWAPDSSHFVYANDGANQVYLGQIGQAPQLLGEASNLRWIDSEHYLWLTLSGSDWVLKLGDLSGGSVDLATGPGSAGGFDFAPPSP